MAKRLSILALNFPKESINNKHISLAMTSVWIRLVVVRTSSGFSICDQQVLTPSGIWSQKCFLDIQAHHSFCYTPFEMHVIYITQMSGYCQREGTLPTFVT